MQLCMTANLGREQRKVGQCNWWVNRWISGSRLFHVEFSRRLNYLTEGAVAIEVKRLLQNWIDLSSVVVLVE